jgi:hypothetical protein
MRATHYHMRMFSVTSPNDNHHITMPFPQESMISVREQADGTFAVIDGMHRTTALQTLLAEKHQGIDYKKVPHRTT